MSITDWGLLPFRGMLPDVRFSVHVEVVRDAW